MVSGGAEGGGGGFQTHDSDAWGAAPLDHCDCSTNTRRLGLVHVDCVGVRHALYAHAGCFPDRNVRSDRRCAWKRKSPWNADVRLYIGASWFASPVPNGEPCAGSLGYSLRSGSTSLLDAPGK